MHFDLRSLSYWNQVSGAKYYFWAGVNLLGGGKISPIPPSLRLGGIGRQPLCGPGNHSNFGVDRNSIPHIRSGNQRPWNPSNGSLHHIPKLVDRCCVGAAKAAPTTTPWNILPKPPADNSPSPAFHRPHCIADSSRFQRHTSVNISNWVCCSP